MKTLLSLTRLLPSAFLAVPLKGLLWFLLIAGVMALGIVFGDNGGVILKIAAFGLVARFFVAALNVGLSEEVTAPKLTWPSSWLGELILPSLAMIFLAFVLTIGPYKLVQGIIDRKVQAAEKTAEREAEKLEASYSRDNRKYESFDREELFLVGSDSRKISRSEAPLVARRIGGGYVKIFPREGYLIPLGKGWKPGDPEPSSRFAAEPDEATEAEARAKELAKMDRVGFFSRGEIGWSFDLGLAIFCLLFAFYYWPMALAVGSASGLFGMYDPRRVLPAAIRGGPAYLLIVSLGLLLTAAVPTVCWALEVSEDAFLLMTVAGLATLTMHHGWVTAANAGFALGATILLMAILSCAQGFLLGRLLAEEPDVLPEAVD